MMKLLFSQKVPSRLLYIFIACCGWNKIAMGDNLTLRKLAFYPVMRTTCTPLVDDRLSDSCWATAPTAATYYEYWKANPALSVLKTEFRMLYSDHGLYLKILNYDQHLDQLRNAITHRDDPSLWTDDCAEIYFDPQANGVGYSKFVINSKAVLGDSRRLDAAVMLDDWSGTDWRASVHITDGGWIIEAYFPWPDLGKKATAGDIWTFDHVRYAYTSGKFVGATWAPGGNYISPGNFGYLYFSDATTIAPQDVGNILQKYVEPPWILPMGNDVITNEFQTGLRVTRADTFAAAKNKEWQLTLQRAENESAHDKKAQSKLEELRVKASNISYHSAAEAVSAIDILADLQGQANQIYWQEKTDTLIEQMAS